MASYDISHDHLLSVLDYNQDTGVFTWRERTPNMFNDTKKRSKEHICNRWNSNFAGKKAGRAGKYVQIAINCKSMLAHVLAWFYVYKTWPKLSLDHHDRNPLNNAINNLREATRGQNSTNSKRKNKTSYKGVTLHKNKKFVAYITINKKQLYLGIFDTAQEAHTAYCDAARKHYGDFASFDQ